MWCNRAVLAAAAAALFAGTAMAAEPSTQQQQTNSSQQAATQDFAHFSQDGFTAVRDIGQARLAIFNGDTDGAKRDVSEAQTALQSARNDGSVFMKAESELKAPKGTNQPAPTGSTERIEWLPVDGGLVLNEDYVPSNAKKQSIQQANAQMAKGDRQGAARTLKLADLNVMVDMEVVPLNKAIAGVDQAEQLLNSGKFFQASQALRGVQNAIRYDEEDFTGAPNGRMANNAGASHG